MNKERRNILKGAVIVGASAALVAESAHAQAAPKVLFEAPRTTIPIVGTSDLFSVRRIYCIGRNYAAHAREMGSDPTREPPFFFQKPTDAIQFVKIGEVADHPYPTLTKNYHYEVELVAALKSGGRNIPIEKALDHVYGYAVGLDMTRRDLQRAMGDEKKPWEIGKSFDKSAPIGPLHRVELAHRSLEVSVDSRRVEAECVFVDEGCAFEFFVAGAHCTVVALPLTPAERLAARGRSLRATLEVAGLGLVREEGL